MHGYGQGVLPNLSSLEMSNPKQQEWFTTRLTVICHGRRVTRYITNKGRERYTTAGTFRMPEITEHELRLASLEATTRVLAPFVTHSERVLR